jgi:hypothetical protein
MTQQSEIRAYVRSLYKEIYQREPNAEEERDFAEHGVLPTLLDLHQESQNNPPNNQGII